MSIQLRRWGMEVVTDHWGVDVVSAGLQKCMSGPPGSTPITISDRAAEHIFARHARASRAMCVGLRAMGLELFGDDRYRMANATGVRISDGMDGEHMRGRLREDFEIGSAFGPLQGRICGKA